MSDAAKAQEHTVLPPGWDRLEWAGERARIRLEAWRARALEAEAEIDLLRAELESVVDAAATSGDSRDAVRRLRAENAALKSRLAQARRRVNTLLTWTDALEETG